jgi:hypothetical protein
MTRALPSKSGCAASEVSSEFRRTKDVVGDKSLRQRYSQFETGFFVHFPLIIPRYSSFTPFFGLDVSRHHQSVYTIYRSWRHGGGSCLFHHSSLNVNYLPCLDYTFIVS